MKTLIVPDIHEDMKFVDFVEETFAKENCDNAVCLGDYWDSFRGVREETRQICVWVARKIRDPKWTMLRGNHDLHYEYAHFGGVRCSGFDPIRSLIIDELFPLTAWKELKWYHQIGRTVLLSHAGFHPLILPKASGRTTELRETAMLCDRTLSRQTMHHWAVAGADRGGFGKVGGLVWLDWKNLEPSPGVCQIVGHTSRPNPRFRSNGAETVIMNEVTMPIQPNSCFCLDAEQKCVAILEGKQLSIRFRPA